VASLARSAGVDEDVVDDLKIAVSEACANSVLGLEELGSDEAISIRFTDDGPALVLEVADRGPAPSETPVEDSQGFDTRSVMSTALLRSLVDDCTIEPRDGGGTVTVLTLNR
jgi:anti-sigma regulatory factor (Ser/Thr protein kinase)